MLLIMEGIGEGAGETTVRYDAVVLAGGRARRAGGAKLGWRREGYTLLDHAVAAVVDARRLVVVGPQVPLELDRAVLWRREEPAYGGPVAALATALPELVEEWTVVLAGDVPGAGAVVGSLLDAATDGVDAVVSVDASGVRQPLLAAYRTAWLRERVPRAGAAARSLLDGARTASVAQSAPDVDTVEDAVRLGFGPPPHG